MHQKGSRSCSESMAKWTAEFGVKTWKKALNTSIFIGKAPKTINKKVETNKRTHYTMRGFFLFISAIVSLIDLVPPINPWLDMHNKSPTVSSHQNASLRSWTSLEESSDHSFVIYVYIELISNISTFLYPQRPQRTCCDASNLGLQQVMIHAWHVCIGSPNPTSTYQTWHSPSSG